MDKIIVGTVYANNENSIDRVEVVNVHGLHVYAKDAWNVVTKFPIKRFLKYFKVCLKIN
ncbi:MAG: hypothetical protein ACRCZ9_09110 [Fusobacteriaceae bacterium]